MFEFPNGLGMCYIHIIHEEKQVRLHRDVTSSVESQEANGVPLLIFLQTTWLKSQVQLQGESKTTWRVEVYQPRMSWDSFPLGKFIGLLTRSQRFEKKEEEKKKERHSLGGILLIKIKGMINYLLDDWVTTGSLKSDSQVVGRHTFLIAGWVTAGMNPLMIHPLTPGLELPWWQTLFQGNFGKMKAGAFHLLETVWYLKDSHSSLGMLFFFLSTTVYMKHNVSSV